MKSLTGEVVGTFKSRYTYAPYPFDMMDKGEWFIFPPSVKLAAARRLIKGRKDLILHRRGMDIICQRDYEWGDEVTLADFVSSRTAQRWATAMGYRVVTRRKRLVLVKGTSVLGRPPKYPWRTMKVGEEFKFGTSSLRSAQQHGYMMGKELGKTFKVQMRGRDVICKRTR
jgi:hypothetical protein